MKKKLLQKRILIGKRRTVVHFCKRQIRWCDNALESNPLNGYANYWSKTCLKILACGRNQKYL